MIAPLAPVKERPILFSGPEVRATLEGRKDQTRRIVKPRPDADGLVKMNGKLWWEDTSGRVYRCPFGVRGDRLWVKEAWGYDWFDEGQMRAHKTVVYRADDGAQPKDQRGLAPWHPSSHMPYWASRITLEVTQVRVQRAQEISEEDAMAEGISALHCPLGTPSGPNKFTASIAGASLNAPTAREVFGTLWDSIHGPGAWERNDWVWAISYRRLVGATR